MPARSPQGAATRHADMTDVELTRLNMIGQDRMRIAQIAPPFESVPPERYGGTERVVATLTDELDRSRCRAEVERRFSPAAMADAYERVYERLIRQFVAPSAHDDRSSCAPVVPSGREIGIRNA